MKRIKIEDINIDVLDASSTVKLVEEYIINKKKLHLMGVNADKINQCRKNEELKRIVNQCGIINADGASVILASRFLKKPLPERVAGIDLMMDLIQMCVEKKYSIYLLGAKEDVIEKTRLILNQKYPTLKICGLRNGYFNDNQWKSIQNDIDEKNPDIVFVGITSPKKEYIIDYFQRNGSNHVYMGVGGSFDVISGNIKRAPKWMQKLNLEWFYRMCQEPGRLFKRYMTGNISFIYHVFLEKFQ